MIFDDDDDDDQDVKNERVLKLHEDKVDDSNAFLRCR